MIPDISLCFCRDGNDDGGSSGLRVTEPQVPWPVPEGAQLQACVHDRRFPRRSVPGLPSPLLLHQTLLKSVGDLSLVSIVSSLC